MIWSRKNELPAFEPPIGPAQSPNGGLDVTVRRYRRRLGLTQEELADRAGVGLRTVRDIELGRTCRPRPSTVRRLAAAFGLTEAEQLRFHELGSPEDAAIPTQNSGQTSGQSWTELLRRTSELEHENALLRRTVPLADSLPQLPPTRR